MVLKLVILLPQPLEYLGGGFRFQRCFRVNQVWWHIPGLHSVTLSQFKQEQFLKNNFNGTAGFSYNFRYGPRTPFLCVIKLSHPFYVWICLEMYEKDRDCVAQGRESTYLPNMQNCGFNSQCGGRVVKGKLKLLSVFLKHRRLCYHVHTYLESSLHDNWVASNSILTLSLDSDRSHWPRAQSYKVAPAHS